MTVPAVWAFPDGAPWEVAGGEGCHQCHFDVPPVESSAAVSLVGLPAAAEPGMRYPLIVRLEDAALENAGFLLSAWRSIDDVGSLEAGRFEADNETVATSGARARSTEAGSRPASPGRAEWSVVWQAPEDFDASIVFDLWANAGNDDKSPFGDATHHRSFELAVDAAASGGIDHSAKSPRTTE